jgi:hypothetical protein
MSQLPLAEIAVRPPAIDSPELVDIISQIAEEAARRRAQGGGRPDFAL